MSILKIFLGEKGEAGTNGINGLGSADVNSFDLEDPILDSLVPNHLSKNAFITYDRTGNSSFVNRYGADSWARKNKTTNRL